MPSTISWRWLSVCVVGLFPAATACTVDPVQPGEECEDEGDQLCRTQQVALFCRDGHWQERDCWVECKYLGYEVGSCGLHSRYGDDTCLCAPDAQWNVGEACTHEGDQECMSTRTLRICLAGIVSEIECANACAGSASSFCGYDPLLGDDSCLCCDTATCP
ncbi:MAG: hypothetical protein JXB32_06605 [Deltaproteobacteria bacterium]|nr:hypothetical protein [Deltaproteobacteria bacterium]